MDLAALRTQQQQLAASVERADRLDRDPPALIGGADVGFEQEGEITRVKYLSRASGRNSPCSSSHAHRTTGLSMIRR